MRRSPGQRPRATLWAAIGCAAAVATVVAQTPKESAGDPAAKLFTDADSKRANCRTADAIGNYESVAAQYPASPWAARAVLEAARCLVMQGQWASAMRQMQDVRQRFPKTPEAERALERNTILHRLRLRPSGQSFRFARTAVNGSAAGIQRVLDVAVDPQNRVYVAMRKSVAVFGDTGALVMTMPVTEFRGLTLSGDVPMLFEERGIRSGNGPLVPIRIPDQNRERDADVQAAALVNGETFVVADRRTRAIHRVSASGAYVSPVASVDVSRIAVGPVGQIAAIERETLALLLFEPDGTAHRVPAQAAGYQLRAPADLAFDPLGHLYVLERDSVIVFAPTGEFLSVFSPGTAAGAFRLGVALDVDAAGRLFIYDEDSERLQVYQ
jgi:Tetratricopeptide repeat